MQPQQPHSPNTHGSNSRPYALDHVVSSDHHLEGDHSLDGLIERGNLIGIEGYSPYPRTALVHVGNTIDDSIRHPDGLYERNTHYFLPNCPDAGSYGKNYNSGICNMLPLWKTWRAG